MSKFEPEADCGRTLDDITHDLEVSDDVITRLELLRELHDWLEAAQTVAVGLAMAQRYTGKEIGAALGVSQQAISKRYGCAKDDEPGEPSPQREKTPRAKQGLMNYGTDGEYVGDSMPVSVDKLPPVGDPREARPRRSRGRIRRILARGTTDPADPLDG